MTSIREPELSSLRAADPSVKVERTQAQLTALAHRNDELERIIAAAGLGYAVLETETARLRANSLFKAEFGYAPDEPLDWESLRARVAPESWGALADAARAALAGGADFDLVVRTQWPNGADQWVALHGRVANGGDNRRSVILTSRNVTAAETASRGKDRFLSVFSHELRSPLNAILGWNRILALKRTADAEVTAISARMEQSARAQLKMLNDLVDLGRIETGKLRVEARPLQLAKVVAAALDLASPTAAAKGVSLRTQFEPGAGQLRGDPDRLQQVVTNLLSNALKFTGSGGEVAVCLRDVAGFAQLSVEDTGQGIAPALLPRVFDRFRHAVNSGGLGLGLTLVREIVTLHGGSVSAESAGVGHGARFVVRLPVRQARRSVDGHAVAPARSAAGSASLDGLSVLVVDDDPDARGVLAETLKLEGARVSAADSASSALEKLLEAGAHFDILVTDIGMPEVDGYSLIRRMRALQSGRRMLAIAVTGYASGTDVEAAMRAGFDLHVPKPVDFNTFVPLVSGLAKKGAGWSHHSPPNGGSSASAL
jgi:signal transduction histidine kinase/CheY-like chemotaxis protein